MTRWFNTNERVGKHKPDGETNEKCRKVMFRGNHQTEKRPKNRQKMRHSFNAVSVASNNEVLKNGMFS
jgi:hypothetical protein